MNRAFHLLKGIFKTWNIPPTPTDLFLFVTDRCNARCRHCFFRYAIDESDGVDLLDLRRIERISKSLRAPLHSITVTGGEPFLREDIVDICDIFRDRNQAEMIVLPTNGLLTERIVTQVDKICAQDSARIYVQVSLDGLGTTHDDIRGVKGAFQCAVATVKGLQALKQQHKHLDVSLNTTLSQRNVGELEALADFARDTLSTPHSFEIVRGAGYQAYHGLNPQWASRANPPDPASGPLSLAELKMLYPRLEQVYRHNTHLIMQSLLTPFVYAYRIQRFWHVIDTLEKRRPFRFCPAGSTMGVIYPNGDVALCELTKPVGHLSEANDDLHAIWTSESAHTMRQHIDKCFCTHGCFQSVAMMREPRMYIRLAQSAVQYFRHG